LGESWYVGGRARKARTSGSVPNVGPAVEKGGRHVSMKLLEKPNRR